MAVQFHPNTYTAFSERVDSSAPVNFYAQLLAKKQAREDAMADYVRNLNTKITPTGMRTVDMDAFNKMKADWQKYGIENQQAMSKDPKKRLEFDTMGQQLMNFIEESKAKESIKKPLVELLTDPTKRSKLSEEVFPMIAMHDKPLYVKDKDGNFVRDYSRQDLDLTNNLFQEPAFDFQKRFGEASKGMTAGTVYDLPNQRTDKTTGLSFIPFKDKYSPTQIEQIAYGLERDVRDDPQAMRYYDRKLGNLSKEEYDKLNKAYQKLRGNKKTFNIPGQGVTEVEDILDTGEKLAFAEAALEAEKFVAKEGEVPKTDWDKRQQAAINKIYLNDDLIRDRKYGSGEGTMIRDIFDEITTKGDLYSNGNIPLTELTTAAQLVALKQAKELTGKNLSNADIYITKKDGKIYIRRVKSKGQSVSNDPYIGEMDFEGTNLSSQPGVAEKREVIRQGSENKQGDYTNVTTGTDAKGNKITIGIKNGKWYNTKTGEEYK